MCKFNNCNTRCNCEKCQPERAVCGCGCSNHWWDTEAGRNARLRQAFREGYEAGFREGARMGACRCNTVGIVPLHETETRCCECTSCD